MNEAEWTFPHSAQRVLDALQNSRRNNTYHLREWQSAYSALRLRFIKSCKARAGFLF